MPTGYLSVQTHPDHEGLVRILASRTHPSGEAGAAAHHPAVRYVARFRDRDAAMMHVHELLRHRLVDIDDRLYRTELATAIAAIESIDLRHERLYVDPETLQRSGDEIRNRTDVFTRRRLWRDRMFRGMGFVGIALLLFNLLFLSLP